MTALQRYVSAGARLRASVERIEQLAKEAHEMARRLKYVEIKNELTGERLCILETEWRLTRNAVDAMFDSSIGTEKVPSDAGYVFVHPFKVTAREA